MNTVYYKMTTDDMKSLSGFQYEMGKTYNYDGDVFPLESGFHCCKLPHHCLRYFPEGGRLFEVKVGGKVIEMGENVAVQKIEFVREFTGDLKTEILQVKAELYGDTFRSFLNGKLHSFDDMPAVESAQGTRKWYQHGELHRGNDLPAVKYSDGGKKWYRHGKPHRENSKPAIVLADGTLFWFRDGVEYRKNDLPTTVFASGHLMWYKNGLPHRDGDKPARISPDGTMQWFRNGLRHRDGGKPAIVQADGKMRWYSNGVFYRESRTSAYPLYTPETSESSETKATETSTLVSDTAKTEENPLVKIPKETCEKYDISDSLFVPRKYRYSKNGNILTFKNGKLHSYDDKPSLVHQSGLKKWHCDGLMHRDGDKPAVIRPDGTKEWYKHGVKYTPE